MGRVAYSMAGDKTEEFLIGLVKRYEGPLHKLLARLLRNDADAADVAQETYLKLSRLTLPTKIVSARAFLFHAARRLAADHYRRRQRSILVPLNVEAAQVTDDTPSAERQLIAGDILQRLIEELPAKQKTAFLMRHILGIPRAEIAKTLGTTVGTVDQYLGRAMAHCQDRLRELGLD